MNRNNKIKQKSAGRSIERVNNIINKEVNIIADKVAKNILFKQYVTITIGAFLMSVALVIYFNELGIVVGGVTGIAVIFNNTLGVPMWVVNTLVNIPLFVLGYKTFEKMTFIKTVYATAMLSLFLAFIPNINLRTDSFPVNVVIGAFFMGMGLGLILSSDASSGGVDMISTMISNKIKYVTIPEIMLIIDGIIITCAISFFGIVKGIYAVIALIIETRISDNIIKGFKRSKLIYIISSSHQELADYIVNTLKRGVSYINIVGGYTHGERKMIMCVVSGRELVKIKQMIGRIDSKSLCFISDVNEAFGEGFTKLT
ncbi:MAG: YitT family protein [Lachnospiraceae bacterium]|nr:YitT family protein [Lachnospiraceae bacterium]